VHQGEPALGLSIGGLEHPASFLPHGKSAI
jgi:hypothetical protein